MKQLIKITIKNFRFWILIVGIIFWVSGLIMQELGQPFKFLGILCVQSPCPNEIPPDALYIFGEIAGVSGAIFSLVGISLLIAQFLLKKLKGSHKQHNKE